MQTIGKAFALCLLAMTAGCVSRTGEAVRQVEPNVDALVAGNSCSAPANEGCSGCQVSCPADMIASCHPGQGNQVLGQGGIYVWQCWVQPTCSCSYPSSPAQGAGAR